MRRTAAALPLPVLLLPLLLAPACGQSVSVRPDPVLPDDDGGGDGSAADGDGTPSPAADDDNGTESQGDGDDDATSPPPSDDDDASTAAGDDADDATPEPSWEPVRWVALGDTGDESADRDLVASAMQSVCASQGCDFALLLGDNFYDVGVESVDDPQWDSKFEVPYSPLGLSFYPVLGNHDGGFFGSGLELWRGDVQVDYTNYSEFWEMPDRFYKHVHDYVDFFALDSSLAFFDGFGMPFITDYADGVDAQEAWLAAEWAGASSGFWRIAYAHHPYLSNGPHGNAGTYEGIPGIPYASGGEVQAFLEANVCGNVDVFLCGHDHSRQWIQTTCNGTNLLISGAGAKTTDLPGSNPSWFQSDVEGFIWFQALGPDLTVQFWNKDGLMDYEGWITK